MTDALLDTLRQMDADATKGPWSMEDFGGVEIDRITYRERPNPKPFVAVAYGAEPEGLCIARGFERAHRHDAVLLVALRNALPELVALIEAADVMERVASRAHSDELWSDPNHEQYAAAKIAYDAARAALAAKIEGAGR